MHLLCLLAERGLYLLVGGVPTYTQDFIRVLGCRECDETGKGLLHHPMVLAIA